MIYSIDTEEIAKEIVDVLICKWGNDIYYECLDRECYDAIADIKADIFEDAEKYIESKNNLCLRC